MLTKTTGTMKLRTKLAVAVLLSLAVVVMAFFPLLQFHNATCPPHGVCIRDYQKSVTRYLLGYGGGGYYRYGEYHYYFCVPSWCWYSWWGWAKTS